MRGINPNTQAYGTDPRRATHWLLVWVRDGVLHADWYESEHDAKQARADARYSGITAWIESQPTGES